LDLVIHQILPINVNNYGKLREKALTAICNNPDDGMYVCQEHHRIIHEELKKEGEVARVKHKRMRIDSSCFMWHENTAGTGVFLNFHLDGKRMTAGFPYGIRVHSNAVKNARELKEGIKAGKYTLKELEGEEIHMLKKNDEYDKCNECNIM
jgi:hypothetical protein